jgi:oxygen-dependent protoporphyrinogen oxidase
MSFNVAIIGAGISGLALAYRLKQRGGNAVLLEARERPGGNIRTFRDDGYTWEAGPNGFLDSKPGTLKLCHDLGLKDSLIAASEASRKNRYLCLNGKLVKLPGSPLGLLTTKAMTWRGKLSLLCEPLRRGNAAEEESVHDFAVRRFGLQAAETIIDALVTGIHGGDPKLLSLPAAFPRLHQWERDAGGVYRGLRRSWREKKALAKANGLPRPGPPRMWSFPGGLQTLVDALAQTLGDTLRCNAPVRAINPCDGGWLVESSERFRVSKLILTAPAYIQSELLAFDPALAAELMAIHYNRIAVVALGYRKDQVNQPDGFGFIAPQNTRRDLLGVQWCSSIFPGRAPEGHVLWRALVGGVHRGELLDLADADLVQTVHRELQAVMNVKGEPIFARIQRWPRAIPQYVLGHKARVERIRALASRHPGLILAGNAFDGVAMNDCVEQAEALAAGIA